MGKTISIIILILIIFGGITYFLINKKADKPSLGAQIYEETKNPLEEKLPETNPFAVETNPAKKAYPNPFD